MLFRINNLTLCFVCCEIAITNVDDVIPKGPQPIRGLPEGGLAGQRRMGEIMSSHRFHWVFKLHKNET